MPLASAKAVSSEKKEKSSAIKSEEREEKKRNRLTSVSVKVRLLLGRHDEGRGLHSLGELLLSLSLVEILGNEDAGVGPHAGLAVLAVLGHLGDNPRAPAEANAAGFGDALHFEVGVHRVEDGRAVLPVELLEPLRSLRGSGSLGVKRLDAAALEEVRHHDVVPAVRQSVAELGVGSFTGAEHVMADDDGRAPVGIAHHVGFLFTDPH